MPMITYEPKRFTPAHEAIIDQAASICREYRAQGYDLTLRQLYYQFVARAIIPNTEQSYKRLGSIVNDARLAGRLDWLWLTDRTRGHSEPYVTDGTVGDLMRRSAESWTCDRWEDQDYWVEVWVEKEALAGVVQRAADNLDVAWMACRGYMSQSTQWAAARRMARKINDGKRVLVLHLGDHDPSGIDMSRDNEDRLSNFIRHDLGYIDSTDFTFKRIALTMDQVDEHDPPPNPAKVTDARFLGYQEIYGDESWELDALPPQILNDLITDEIEAVLDRDRYDARFELEAEMHARALAMMEAHGHELDA